MKSLVYAGALGAIVFVQVLCSGCGQKSDISHFRSAAAKGDADAQYTLGVIDAPVVAANGINTLLLTGLVDRPLNPMG